MMYFADYEERRGWRIKLRTIGAVMEVDICGAINEQVAKETADELNRVRAHQ